jgi:nucleoside-diphosphate-sugar epimerase
MKLLFGVRERKGRDLLYIDDLVSLIELAIKKQKKKFGLFNVGYGKLKVN